MEPEPRTRPPPPPPPKSKVKVKLADGKERMIQNMVQTRFWHPDDTPMSSAEFMQQLYGKLPEFFKEVP